MIKSELCSRVSSVREEFAWEFESIWYHYVIYVIIAAVILGTFASAHKPYLAFSVFLESMGRHQDIKYLLSLLSSPIPPALSY
jgi:hypothetical protein